VIFWTGFMQHRERGSKAWRFLRGLHGESAVCGGSPSVVSCDWNGQVWGGREVMQEEQVARHGIVRMDAHGSGLERSINVAIDQRDCLGMGFRHQDLIRWIWRIDQESGSRRDRGGCIRARSLGGSGRDGLSEKTWWVEVIRSDDEGQNAFPGSENQKQFGCFSMPS
jgi:hypothetical protein